MVYLYIVLVEDLLPAMVEADPLRRVRDEPANDRDRKLTIATTAIIKPATKHCHEALFLRHVVREQDRKPSSLMIPSPFCKNIIMPEGMSLRLMWC